MFRWVLLLAALSISGATASASIQIPRNLNSDDRKEVTRILGFSTSAKILTDPYPLGGYSGFQAGVLVEDFPLDGLSDLGSHLSSAQRDMTVAGISLAKGLYDDIDVFFQWVPYTNGTQTESWGGMVRWSFYQASFLPLSFSATARGNISSFDNLVSTRSAGLDFTAGLNVNYFAIFAGLGPVYANGHFIGGTGTNTSPLTDSGNPESASVTTLHSMIGLSFEYSWIFAVAEIDHYSETVYSAQIGAKF